MNELVSKISALGSAAEAEIKAEIENAKSAEDVVAILASRGINTTVEELANLFNNEELDESEMEQIAGGSLVTDVGIWLGKKLRRKCPACGMYYSIFGPHICRKVRR